MRIAVVTETYPPEVNGVAMTTGRMVSGLMERGHHVELIRPRQEADKLQSQRNEFSRTSSTKPANNHRGRLEEVLTLGVPIPRYPGLKLGLPAKRTLTKLWTAQRPDIVQIVTEGPLGSSALSVARKLQIPVISDFHTNFHHYCSHYGVGWLNKPIASFLRRFHNRSDATLVPTHAMQADLRRDGYQNVQVISRGVDTQLFNPQRRSAALRESWGIQNYDETELVALYVGRVAAEKNLPLVLRAFEAMQKITPKLRLVFVGDGPARAALQAKYPQHIFAGMRTGEDLATHYASADIFLFPSLTETFGNVTTEAMASGLAVVAYDYAAAAQLILDGENGHAAPFDQADAFISAACRLVGNSTTRNAMRLQARVSVEHLDWAHIVTNFTDLVVDVVTTHERKMGVSDASILAQN